MSGAAPRASAVTGVVSGAAWPAAAVGRCMDEMCCRCCCVEDLKGSVGKSCRRYLSHCSTAGRGTRSGKYTRFDQQAANRELTAIITLTDLVDDTDELLAISLAPANLLLDKLGTSAQWVPGVEDLVDDSHDEQSARA